jgi:hypothetical protein
MSIAEPGVAMVGSMASLEELEAPLAAVEQQLSEGSGHR